MSPPAVWRCGMHALDARPRALVMGIVNVTPDSFSDGGAHASSIAAIRHGVALAADGADILDIGGESTRPGAEPVPVEEELRRVVPVVRALVRETGLPVSIDTMKAPVAAAAIGAGASIINDVAAFRLDPGLFRVARESGAGVVLMHMRGDPRTMQQGPRYDDVVEEVAVFLAERMSAALSGGIAADRIALDPGIGFGKTAEHNLRLLRELPALIRRTTALARPEAAAPPPFLIGLSRKSVVGHVTGRPVSERLAGSLAGAVMAWRAGARIIRVHDVKETCDALKFAYATAPDVPH